MTINVPEGCPIQLVCTILMNRDIPNSHRSKCCFFGHPKAKVLPHTKKNTWFVMFFFASMLRFPKSLGYP